MEDVEKLLKALMRSELERYLAMVYLSWIPALSAGLYLAMLFEKWILVGMASIVGLVLYLWAVVSYAKLFRPSHEWKRGYTITSVLSIFITSWLFALLGLPAAWGIAVGIMIMLFIFALKYRYRSWKVDIGIAISLVILTLIGSSRLNPWISFTQSVIVTYSIASLTHLAYGIYEVMPYVLERPKER